MEPAFMDEDAASDYGSDFTAEEETILNSLLLQVPVELPANPVFVLQDIEDHENPRGARVPRMYGSIQALRRSSARVQRETASAAVEMADNSVTALANLKNLDSHADREGYERSASIEAPIDPQPSMEPEEPDPRSPLERFRTKPMKALSVTDLISPSWCELQYWYSLTKHGKKKRTPAMKQGTAVHKTLEEQVHHTVAIDIQTKEDTWGLRVWNIIQGLRAIRQIGMTRELEVWGVIDGLVVNGVIDELSYVCPDRELEQKTIEGIEVAPPVPANQTTITDFLSPNGSQNLTSENYGVSGQLRSTLKQSPSIYISDVKTRNTASIPKAASFRPTLMQLMLYHRLLSRMVTGDLDTTTLFSRYELQADAPFTDTFIAQISEIFYDAPSDPSQSSQIEADTPDVNNDIMDLLLAHNSLNKLWALMQQEFQATFPQGQKNIGKVLQAEYRSATDGVVMGAKTFLYDDAVLETYLQDEMRWWKGERPAAGVCLEEAWKCGFCEFAEGCDWRMGKIEEAREKARMEKGRRRSAV